MNNRVYHTLHRRGLVTCRTRTVFRRPRCGSLATKMQQRIPGTIQLTEAGQKLLEERNYDRPD